MNLILLFLLPSILAIVSLPWIKNHNVSNYWSALLASLSFLLAIPLIISSYTNPQPLFFYITGYYATNSALFSLA